MSNYNIQNQIQQKTKIFSHAPDSGFSEKPFKFNERPEGNPKVYGGYHICGKH